MQPTSLPTPGVRRLAHRCASQLTVLALLLAAAGCASEAAETPRATPEAESTAASGGNGVTVTQTDAGYLFAEGRDSVLLYRRRAPHPERTHARNHYVHPLYGLDGTVLTEDAPDDHLHQHGLFWAWHQVFVNGSERVGDGWTQEDIAWRVPEVEILDEASPTAALRAHVAWHSPRYHDADGQEAPFVEETTTLRVHPAADGGRYRAIDVTIALRALADSVRLGGSDNEKGYGGFSARLRLPDDVQFVGPGGPVTPQTTAVTPGPWVDVSATFAEPQPSGVALLQHPSVPGFPQPWILRREASMQNAKWPGAAPILLPQDEPLTLRYRLVVHQGRAQAVPLAQLHDRYAASAPPPGE